MPKTIRIALNPNSIDRAIRELESYRSALERKLSTLIQRLADIGFTVASAGYQNAIYDGTNDVSVAIEDGGALKKAVVAVGSAVLFIEFGTGVFYADNYPGEKPAGISERGGYGKGRGKQNTWGYYGDPGTNGVEITKPNGKTVVLTHGNPSNPVMYNSTLAMKQAIAEIAKEVFST